MLREFYELASQAGPLSCEGYAREKAQFKELQQQGEELTAAVQRLGCEVRPTTETDAHEREKMALRLENALLRFERRLPQSRQSPRDDQDDLGE